MLGDTHDTTIYRDTKSHDTSIAEVTILSRYWLTEINAHWQSFFISVYRYSDLRTGAKAALITRQKIIISVMSCVDEAQGNVTWRTTRTIAIPQLLSAMFHYFLKYWTLEIAVMGHWRSLEIWPAWIPVWFSWFIATNQKSGVFELCEHSNSNRKYRHIN